MPRPPLSRRLPQLVFALYGAFVVALIVAANVLGTGTVFALPLRLVPHADKVGHLVLMGLLAATANAALQHRRVGAAVPLGSALIFALVGLEEASQAWLPTRSFDLLDLAADAVGIALASAWSLRQRARPTTLVDGLSMPPPGPAS